MIRRTALAAAALLVLAAPAAAASDVHVKGVDTSDYPTVHVSVVTTGSLSRQPGVSENGSSVTGLQAENLGREKSVVLAVDTSRSMEGKALKDAARAARAFVAAKPPDEETSSMSRSSRLLTPLMCSGLKPHFLEKMSANGVTLPPAFFEQDDGSLRPAFAAASYGGFK